MIRVSRRAIAGLLLVASCSQDAPLFGSREEPAVYMVLSREAAATVVDSALLALAVTTRGPFSTAYLAPLVLEVRRDADGSLLDFEALPLSGPVPVGAFNEIAREAGNLRLPWTGTDARLGRGDLTGGDVFELTLSANGVVVTGRTRIPLRPTPVVVDASGVVSVAWPRDAAAGGYRVILDTEGCCSPLPLIVTTTDTSIVLTFSKEPAQRPDPAFVRVIAYDSAHFRYLLSDTVSSAGVVGAFGLFGATNSDSVVVPALEVSSTAAPVPRPPRE